MITGQEVKLVGKQYKAFVNVYQGNKNELVFDLKNNNFYL